MLRPGRSKLASLLALDFGPRPRRHGMLGLGLLIVAFVAVILINQLVRMAGQRWPALWALRQRHADVALNAVLDAS
jgi:hypothetical protein